MADAGGSIDCEVGLRLCGRLRLEVDGHAVDDGPLGQLGRLALGFLAAERHRQVTRDELAEAVWGERLPSTWPDALRGVVSRSRAVLESGGLPGPQTLTGAAGCYQLRLPAGARVDVEQAEDALSGARAGLDRGRADVAVDEARRALALTEGRFLAGSGGEWVERRQRAIDDLRLDALDVLAAAATACGQFAVAVDAAEDAIALQPLRESAYLRLVEAHAAAGNRAEALRAYERCRRTLAEELGVDPSATTEAAYLDLLADAPPPATAPERPAARLPGSITSFVGRGQAIAEVRKALRTARLVSLVGVGGVGKSRLALQVAGELSGEYADGVWLVELAGIGDPGLVAPQVLAVVGGPEGRSEPASESLARHVDSSRLLLVLDNCEHLIDACADLVARLLPRCPGLQVLATSREPLGVAGETVWPVPPLTTPDPDDRDHSPALVEFEAVRLFVDRAGAVAPDLHLDDRTLTDVAAIVRRLDGIPLAIELAAAWTKVLSVGDIAANLDDRFRLLVGGPRTAPARHQTLRAALDWSYEALAPDEAAVLRRLSVFAGGFTLEAAESVCRAGGLDVDVLQTLSGLFDKSLVLVDRSRRATRYRQLETVRQYAADHLSAAGEEAGSRRDHLRWALALAEATALEGPEQATWLDALDADHDNLRAALDWAASSESDQEVGARIASALCRYWEVRGWLGEGRAHLANWTSREGLPPTLRARLLNSAGVLAQRQRDFEAARGWYEECLVVRRSLDEELGAASALHGLGNIAYLEGDLDTARARFEENLALARRLGVGAMVAASLLNLGVIEHTMFMRSQITKEEADARGRTAMLDSLAEYERIGDRHGMALAYENLGTISAWLGEPRAAISYQEQSLAIRRELGDKPGIALSARYLSRLALQTGDCGTARGLSEECLAIERELGKAADEAEALAFLAQVAMAEHAYDEARSLLDESVGMHRQRGEGRVPPWMLSALGEVACAQQDFPAARVALEEMTGEGRRTGEVNVVAGGLSRLALVELAEGRVAEAAADAAEILADEAARGTGWVLFMLAEAAAGVSLCRGGADVAVRLLAAADAIRRGFDPPARRPHPMSVHDDTMAGARAVLGDEAFAAAWAAGGALEGTRDDLVALLQSVVSLPAPPPS